LEKGLFDHLHVEKWKSHSIRYVIAPKISKDRLYLKVYDVYQSEFQQLNPIFLTSSIEKDRPMLHKIADLLHHSLFQAAPIFQKKIVFSRQLDRETPTSFEEMRQRARQKTLGSWSSEIWECGFDGQNMKQLTNEKSYSISPLYIPTERKRRYNLLYVCYKQGQPKIYLKKAEEDTGRSIVKLSGNQLLPALSKDWNQIAYITDVSGKTDLFLQPFDYQIGGKDKPQQLYSYGMSLQSSPSFGPDGKMVAFVSDQSGTPRVYILHLAQFLESHSLPKVECISTLNRDNTAPSFSPDGKKIVYSSKTDGVRQLWLYDIEKKEEVQLTMGPENKENPCFATNGLHIVYNTTTPTTDLFILNLNNVQPVKISRSGKMNHYPSWEP